MVLIFRSSRCEMFLFTPVYVKCEWIIMKCIVMMTLIMLLFIKVQRLLFKSNEPFKSPLLEYAVVILTNLGQVEIIK